LAKDLTKLSLLPSIETVDFTGCGFIANKNLAGLKRAIAERKPNTFFEIVNSKKILVRQRSKEPMQSAIVMGANMLEGELWSSDQFIAFLRQRSLVSSNTQLLAQQRKSVNRRLSLHKEKTTGVHRSFCKNGSHTISHSEVVASPSPQLWAKRKLHLLNSFSQPCGDESLVENMNPHDRNGYPNLGTPAKSTPSKRIKTFDPFAFDSPLLTSSPRRTPLFGDTVASVLSPLSAGTNCLVSPAPNQPPPRSQARRLLFSLSPSLSPILPVVPHRKRHSLVRPPRPFLSFLPPNRSGKEDKQDKLNSYDPLLPRHLWEPHAFDTSELDSDSSFTGSQEVQ